MEKNLEQSHDKLIKMRKRGNTVIKSSIFKKDYKNEEKKKKKKKVMIILWMMIII